MFGFDRVTTMGRRGWMTVGALACAAALTASAEATPVPIEVTPVDAGTGANTAYVLINFTGGDVSLFRVKFDGTATGADLLTTLDALPGFELITVDFGPGFGIAVQKIAYNGHSFEGFGFEPGPGDTFDYGYWGYYTRDTSADAWAESFIGPSTRTVSDGSWDGYGWTAGINNTGDFFQDFDFAGAIPPDVTIKETTDDGTGSATPEPASLGLLAMGVTSILAFRRRSR